MGTGPPTHGSSRLGIVLGSGRARLARTSHVESAAKSFRLERGELGCCAVALSAHLLARRAPPTAITARRLSALVRTLTKT